MRHAYAVANTCHGIGERILDLIDGRIGGRAGAVRVDGRSRESRRAEENRRHRPMATRGAGR